MLNNKSSFRLALVASFGLLAACGQLRQLSEMHDSTGEMRDTTKEMSQQTKEMNAQTKQMGESTKNMEGLTAALGVKTEELRAMTSQLLQVGKQGISMGLREEILKKLESSTTQVEKLGKAAKYFMAFEYQVWNGTGPDTPATRDEQMGSAAREFMREVQRFVGDNARQNGVIAISSPEAVAKVQAKIDKEAAAKAQTIADSRAKTLEEGLQARQDAALAKSRASGTTNVKGLSEAAMAAAQKEIEKARVVTADDIEKAKKDNDYNALLPQLKEGSTINALAVAMHIANPLQEELVHANPKVQLITMYSMIQEALLAEKEIEAKTKKPADYPAYVNEIRSFLDVAKTLVRSRVNALGFMALTRVSALLADADPVEKLTKMSMDKWSFETSSLNSKAIRDTALFLEGAIKTRDFMQKAGIAEDEIGSTKPVFANGQPNDEMKAAREAVTAAKAAAGGEVDERTAALAELMDRIEQFRK